MMDDRTIGIEALRQDVIDLCIITAFTPDRTDKATALGQYILALCEYIQAIGEDVWDNGEEARLSDECNKQVRLRQMASMN